MELTKVDLEKIKQAKNEYHKEWSKKNKEKIKEYTKTYWLKKIREREAKNNVECGNKA